MDDNLTAKQMETLTGLLELHEEQGYFPTVRELAARLDRSGSTTHVRLTQLEEAGVLVRERGQPRAIRLLASPWP